ncbi:MFS transporter [Flavobacterium piscis]|uniref:NNP family nitrate/nitrite transporter-like MFS transporter n=1 Tax=Flavobacterium piscis TaxID=1114874 RepID=A0ABU1YDL1_9FLAO|nr:MFS transporter [Flavobacterium piscis]MDR7212319.1 NNP family nitrate/nitrite transporter-like MFS transporter [Flavobacterium piscis]
MSQNSLSHRILFLNTLAFAVCFACWTLNGVLVTFLVDREIFDWDVVQIGWLLGIPVLTGSIMRLPMGILTDKFGGRIVYSALLVLASIPLFLLPFATNFWMFAFLSFLFGMVGTSFAVGVAYTSIWYPKEWQGRALGIFGMGTAGASITPFLAPTLLSNFSETDPENGWKWLPIIYGSVLLLMGIVFLIFSKTKKVSTEPKTVKQLLQPLKSVRVWRFGTYYFLLFGSFVTFSQWLLPNFMNVYHTTLIVGGLFTTCFSLPAGIVRAVGGFLSDKFGARKVMYWVLSISVVLSFLLLFPKMDITTTGSGLMASKAGTVTQVSSDKVTIGDRQYPIMEKDEVTQPSQFFPSKKSWQEVVVAENQKVQKKELLAEGITQIHFEANMWVYLVLVILIGTCWGIGSAAVYKHIPDYFPNEVGVIGGMVGMLGGLGGFVGPIVFGYLLSITGFWTSSWMFIFVLSLICLIWMHRVVVKMTKEKLPHMAKDMDRKE